MYGIWLFAPLKAHLTKALAEKHWYCCNNAVRLLNKAKSRLVQSIMNFENRLDFICRQAGGRQAGLPA